MADKTTLDRSYSPSNVPRVTTWKVKPSVRVSVLIGELDRIYHRSRPHLAYVPMEDFLSSRPLVGFDDETKHIRAETERLMRRVYASVPHPRYSAPLQILPYYGQFAPETKVMSRAYGRPTVSDEILQMSYYNEPSRTTIGRGHLACISYAGGRGYPRRKHLFNDETRDIGDEIKCRSYYTHKTYDDAMSLATGFSSHLLSSQPEEQKRQHIYHSTPIYQKKENSKTKADNKSEDTKTNICERLERISKDEVQYNKENSLRKSSIDRKEEIVEQKQTSILKSEKISRKLSQDKADISSEKETLPRKASLRREESEELFKTPSRKQSQDKPEISSEKDVPPRKSNLKREDSEELYNTTSRKLSQDKPEIVSEKDILPRKVSLKREDSEELYKTPLVKSKKDRKSSLRKEESVEEPKIEKKQETQEASEPLSTTSDEEKHLDKDDIEPMNEATCNGIKEEVLAKSESEPINEDISAQEEDAWKPTQSTPILEQDATTYVEEECSLPVEEDTAVPTNFIEEDVTPQEVVDEVQDETENIKGTMESETKEEPEKEEFADEGTQESQNILQEETENCAETLEESQNPNEISEDLKEQSVNVSKEEESTENNDTLITERLTNSMEETNAREHIITVERTFNEVTTVTNMIEEVSESFAGLKSSSSDPIVEEPTSPNDEEIIRKNLTNDVCEVLSDVAEEP